MYRALVQNGAWVPYSTTSTVKRDGNVLHFDVPCVDIFPGSLGFTSSTLIAFPTITNGMVIDDLGLPDDLSGMKAVDFAGGGIFSDGFVSGDTTAWSTSEP